MHIVALHKRKDTSTHVPHFQTVIAYENPNVKKIIIITFTLPKNLSHHNYIHSEFFPPVI